MHGSGSAGPGLRSQGISGKGTLSRCARGDTVIASRARSGPIPLLSVLERDGLVRAVGFKRFGCGYRVWAPRDRACARREARGRGCFRAACGTLRHRRGTSFDTFEILKKAFPRSAKL